MREKKKTLEKRRICSSLGDPRRSPSDRLVLQERPRRTLSKRFAARSSLFSLTKVGPSSCDTSSSGSGPTRPTVTQRKRYTVADKRNVITIEVLLLHPRSPYLARTFKKNFLRRQLFTASTVVAPGTFVEQRPKDKFLRSRH